MRCTRRETERIFHYFKQGNLEFTTGTKIAHYGHARFNTNFVINTVKAQQQAWRNL